jgi:hypothetical protein
MGIDPRTHRLAAQRLNHYASPGPIILLYFTIKTTSEEQNYQIFYTLSSFIVKFIPF